MNQDISRPDVSIPSRGTGPAWRRPVALLTSVAGLAVLSALTCLLLYLPDVLLKQAGLVQSLGTRRTPYWIVAAVALLLTSMASRRARLWTIAFLTFNQIIWIGCAVFFGQTLAPEQLLLARYEMSDTVTGALSEWRTLMPYIAAVLAVTLAVTALQWPQFGTRVLRSKLSGWAMLAVMVAGGVFWAFHKRIEVAFPGPHTPSIYGPYQAAVSTLRMASSGVAASAGMEIRDQNTTALPMGAEPVTVVVIMGESINPYRLSVLGFNADTTPGLARWLSAPPANFELIPKVGVSGGTATYGSVPTFLRMAYLPVKAQETGLNLFDLADRQGFQSWYFSAQTKNFLDAAGGAKRAVRIETELGNEAKLHDIKDDILAEFAREVPSGPDRRLIFFHQRVNHTSYDAHCTHAPDGMYPFKDSTGTANGIRRTAYDNGLRCWDRNVTNLAAPFLQSPGAVYVFIMADHNELMGEAGLWGHGMADVHSAIVPMMLFTNRPASPVAEKFRQLSPPTTYRMAQTVALALGLDVKTPGIAPGRFYLNSTMPFGLAGFMEVDHIADAGFRVTTFSRTGKQMNTKELNLPELVTGRVPGESAQSVSGMEKRAQ